MNRNLILVVLLIYSTNYTFSQNINVNNGGKLTVQKNGYVVIDGNLNNYSNTDDVSFNSDSDEFSSLIVRGNSSEGSITYNRWVNSFDNYGDLVGSPLTGQVIGEFINENSSIIDAAGTYYAFAQYDNEFDQWINHDVNSTQQFQSGRGYAIATALGAQMAFKGGVEISDSGLVYLGSNFIGNETDGSQWVLVSNPYPSYIHANPYDPTSMNDFMSENTDIMDPNYVAIYGWKQLDSYNYQVFNHTTPTPLYIAPGQAFMLALVDATNTTFPPPPPFYPQHVYFQEDMQTYIGGDDFIQGDPLVLESDEFVLRLYNNDTFMDYTRFYFSDEMTLGLDPGYDAGHFNQTASLMSRLPQFDNGIGFIINAMSLSEALMQPIPIEINQSAGQEFRINLHSISIENQEIYLEDSLNQTFTLLNDEDFTLTPDSDLSGIGRFFVHIGDISLSNNESNLFEINAYKKIGVEYIQVEGLSFLDQNANFELYDVVGKLIKRQKLSNNVDAHRIPTSNLSKGVYLINILSSGRVFKKKIIVD